jgi:ankyrin repeat protein
MLLDANADSNVQTNEGDAPLHHSAFRGDYKMCYILLGKGANPNIQNFTLGRSPLHYAVDYNHAKIVELLMFHEASPMIQDR